MTQDLSEAAQLRVRVRQLEADLEDARLGRLSAEADLARSDELRAAIVAASADTARHIVTAINRLAEYQPIVEAAVKWVQATDASERGNYIQPALVVDAIERLGELRRLTEHHIETIKKRS